MKNKAFNFRDINYHGGFTLVELIVTITILAILGTIAFISLQGYSTSARDGTRVSDISSMRSSLELFQLDSGKYPIPTNGENITYSGSIVWTQGIFGESVFNNIDKLDKIPLDPVTEKEYTYSTTEKRNEYQLGGIMEGDEIATSSQMTKEVLAAEATTTATAYIVGSYNGMLIKTNSGTTCNILSIPSLVTNDTTITNLQTIVQNESFAYRGYKNLPGSFKGSRFKFDGGFAFKTKKLVVYSDTGSCTALTDTTNSGATARVNLLNGLKQAYSGTLLKNTGELKNIIALDINTSSPSNEVLAYAGNFVNNVFGSKILAKSNITINYSCATQPNYTHATFTTGTPTQVNQVWQNTNSGAPCYYTCNSGYTGVDCNTVISTRVYIHSGSTGYWWNYMGNGCSNVPYDVNMLNHVKKLCKENGYQYDYVVGSQQCVVRYGEGLNSKLYTDAGNNTNYTLYVAYGYVGMANYYFFDSIECIP